MERTRISRYVVLLIAAVLMCFAGGAAHERIALAEAPTTPTADAPPLIGAHILGAGNVAITGGPVHLAARLVYDNTMLPEIPLTLQWEFRLRQGGALVATYTAAVDDYYLGSAEVTPDPVIPLDAYDMTVRLLPNPYYAAEPVTYPVGLPVTATLSYTGDTVATGSPFTLSSHLDVAAGTVPVGALQVQYEFMQGITVVYTTVATVGAQGDVEVSVAWIPVGPYELVVSLLPNPYYTAAPVSFPIAAGTALTVDGPALPYGQTATLRATLMSGSVPVFGQIVHFSVNGMSVGIGTTNGQGVATVPYTAQLPVGIYTIDAFFAGSYDKGASMSIGVLIVTHAPGSLHYTGSTLVTGAPVDLRGQFAADTGSVPAGALTMEFTLRQGGTTIATYRAPVDSWGSAVVTPAPTLAPDEYDVTVSLVPNGYYIAPAATAHISIPGAALTEFGPFSGAYGATTTLSARLQAGSAPLAGRSVIFSVNGTDLPAVTTDAAGLATAPYSIVDAAGQYPAAVRFAGDAFSPATSAQSTLQVTRAGATLTYTGDTVAAGGAFRFAARLTPTQGAVPEGLSVLFVLKRGATQVEAFKIPVGPDGNAEFTDSYVHPEAYTLSVELWENGYFTAAPAATQLKVGTNLAATNLFGEYGTTVNLTATLKALYSPMPGKTLHFTVDGVPAGSAVTDANGVATVAYPVTLMPGPHTIGVSFAGDADAAPSSTTGLLTVTLATTQVSAANVTGVRNSTAVLKATVTSGSAPLAGVTVTFMVAGQVVGTAVTDANGVAALSYALSRSVGTYQISVSYGGDSKYSGAFGTATLTITRK